MSKFLDFTYLRRDALGGITAGIVALPLALAFGEQSGLGAANGLYGAAFIAFFAALFGGTATQISGPTAPMTVLSMVIIAGILESFEGRLEEALPVILAVFLLAGLIQIGMGLLKLGSYIKYIPHPVVSGFMTGIGVMIILTQLLPILGYQANTDTVVVDQMRPAAEEVILERILKEEAADGTLVLEEFKKTYERTHEVSSEAIDKEARLLAGNSAKGVLGAVKSLPRALKQIKWFEFLLALITIVIIYGFPKITRKIPSALVALLVVTPLAHLSGKEFRLISEIPSGFPAIHLDIVAGFGSSAFFPYIGFAVLLALLGAIDSLLTSVVADNLTRTQHRPDRELIGQGVGNAIASFFAGLPGAGATVRTVVNIHAGGRTKISGMIAGIMLFCVMLFLGPLASMIPSAVLAGLLLTVGIGVMDRKGLAAIPNMQNSDKVILITVLLLTVFWQLVYAVFVGLVLASFAFMKRMSDISKEQVAIKDLKAIQERDPLWNDEYSVPEEIREKVLFKHLVGPLFFGMASDFKKQIAKLPEIHLLVLRMEKVPFIDQSGYHALHSALDELHERGVVVMLTGLNSQSRKTLERMSIIPRTISERHIFDDFASCREWFIRLIENEAQLEEELRMLKEEG